MIPATLWKLVSRSSPSASPIEPRAVRWLGRAAWGGALLAALAGCSILPKSEPIDTYRLPDMQRQTAAAHARSDTNQVHALSATTLRINRPLAAGVLAGQQMAVVPTPTQVSVYKGARWAEPLPVLVRNRILDAFLQDGRVPSLSNDERGIRADFELDSDLRAFQSEYQGAQPEAVVRLDVRLVQSDTQRIVASQRFEMREAVAGKQVPEVVQALGRASDGLARQLVSWSVEQMLANPIQPKSKPNNKAP